MAERDKILVKQTATIRTKTYTTHETPKEVAVLFGSSNHCLAEVYRINIWMDITWPNTFSHLEFVVT